MSIVHPRMSHEAIINIRGEKLGLGPVRAELADLYVKWMNDFDVTRTMDLGNRPITREYEAAWFQKRAMESDTDRIFTIHELATMRPIGNTGLHAINLLHRSAEFGIMIGEKDCWGKGYGTEAARLCLTYGFKKLNLNSIYLRAYANNEYALKAYERVGFRHIGRRREAVFLDGKPVDVVYMDVLSREFLAQ